MTIQVIGRSGTIQEVDATFKASRVSLRPYNVNNWYSISLKCPSLSGFGSPDGILAFRNTSETLIAVRRVTMSVGVTKAYLTGFSQAFTMYKVKNFTAIDTGGATVGSTFQNKRRESMPNSLIYPDIKISNAGTALTAGAGTVETRAISTINFFVFGIGTGCNKVDYFNCGNDSSPLIFGKNEGFRIRTDVNFAATGVMTAYFVIDFTEMVK